MTRTDTVSINVRIPSGLWEVLREQARREHRSMNAEIVKAIESAIDPRPPKSTQERTDAN